MRDYASKANAEHDDLNAWHRVVLETIPLKGKNVLDLGAGTGRFLEEARRAGANVFAVDPNPRHEAYFTKRHIDHRIGFLTADVGFVPDIITCFEVIEHLYDPNPLFDVSRALLSQRSGEFIVSTPNALTRCGSCDSRRRRCIMTH